MQAGKFRSRTGNLYQFSLFRPHAAIPGSDGHYGPRFLGELDPCLAACGEDLILRREDEVREPGVTHVLPDVLDRVELRRSWRQGYQPDVGWQVEFVGGVPARLIQYDDAMRAGCDLCGDLVEMPLHGGDIASWHDHGRAGAARRTDGAEYVGRLGALILGRRGSGAPPSPPSGDLGLLTNPGFILPPDLYRRADRERGLDQRQRAGETFSKASSACSFWA